jgi:hypothetical protein
MPSPFSRLMKRARISAHWSTIRLSLGTTTQAAIARASACLRVGPHFDRMPSTVSSPTTGKGIAS